MQSKLSSMKKLPKQYDREYMKMAMLQHEETFRHQCEAKLHCSQVNELHRLYQIQKILMSDMKAEIEKQSSNERRPGQTLPDLELPAEEISGGGGGNGSHGTLKDEEEGRLELTLATGSKRMKKDEASFTSDSGASFSCSSAESTQLSKFLSERKKDYDDEEQVSQNRMNRPPWLLQCLSFKMS
ncbi:hypothetical protein KSP40_PGU012965 [Platanthera guangdongensis]|uniref:Uncharacterized protein n=1 Tax=Platanthera guangdongensis TaxID=2320717 RepID=A0ABR2MGU5_9ASPA